MEREYKKDKNIRSLIMGAMSADYYLRTLESKGCITRIKRGTWQVNK